MPEFHLLTEYQKRKVYKTCCSEWLDIKTRMINDFIIIEYTFNNKRFFTKIKAN